MHSYIKKPLLLKISSIILFYICLLFAFNVAAESRFNAPNRYLYIQPGQSIFSIVKVIYPDQQDNWPAIIKNIVKHNPHAFIGADASKIREGERLKLPSLSSAIKPVATSVEAVIFKGPRSVGQVIHKRGKTFSISRDDKTRNLDLGNEVFVGDRIFTGVHGFIRLSMIDGAKIDLRCNSEMLIEDYQLMRGGNRSVIYLIKGSVKKITGSIGKMADDIYEMHTPLATVGVRGTEYAIRVLQAHGCDGSLDVNSDGLFVKVNKGAIDVHSKHQQVALNKGDEAHLAEKDSQMVKIQTNDGVFEPVAGENRKSQVVGSFVWLLLLAPLIVICRKKARYAN